MIIKCLLNDYNKSYGYSNPYTILFTLEFLILKHKLYPGILYFYKIQKHHLFQFYIQLKNPAHVLKTHLSPFISKTESKVIPKAN